MHGNGIEAAASVARIARGACHMHYAYDLALAIDLDEAERLVRDASQRQQLKHRRRTPRYFEYTPAPLRVTRVIEPLVVSGSKTAPSVDCVLFDFGAASVNYSIPIGGPLTALESLSEALYDNDALRAHSRRIVEELLETIRPAARRPAVAAFEEDYAIFHVEAFEQASIEVGAFLESHAPSIARILRADPITLSTQEVEDALACRVSYAANDAAVIDWNGALLLGDDVDDLRAALEFANVELLELRWLDQQLDGALDRAFGALKRQGWKRRFLLGSEAADMRLVAELQMESALTFENVNNALKLLGDQHLARVYRLASQRFHLPAWDASIMRKLETVESVYQKITDAQATRRLEALEWIIIILIAVSVLLML